MAIHTTYWYRYCDHYLGCFTRVVYS